MDGSEGPADTGRHGLGPHVVGQRVVVRRVLRGQTGPSGGPAMTDVLGICLSWSDGVVTVEREDGTTVAIRTADIVSGKPVPPRPEPRRRGSAGEHEARLPTLWPHVSAETFGEWLLLDDPTSTEPNVALAFGDPGVPLPEAVARLPRWWGRVESGSEIEAAFVAAGWSATGGEQSFMVAGLSRVHRALRGVVPAGELRVDGPVADVVSEHGRVHLGVDGDWLGINDLWVEPSHRREGHGRALLAQAVEYGAERGATGIWLCVAGDNRAARNLYESLGFSTHHHYKTLSRFATDDVARRAGGLFVPSEVVALGEWQLRHVGGVKARPNSVLTVGDPGMPLDEALVAVTRWYADRDRAPWLQVVTDSALHRALEQRGWQQARPVEADAEVLLADVAEVARRLADVEGGDVIHADRLTPDWLVGNEGALANYEAVERSLRLRDAVFASVEEDGRQVARGRANIADGWALVADLTVQPEHRRRGLARVVMADLTRWASERGAHTMLLQVIADNEPAQRLYAALGFQRHHACRYLTPSA